MTPTIPTATRAFRSAALGACVAAFGLLAIPALAADEADKVGQSGCCLTEAAQTLGFEASEPGPFLDLTGDEIFQAFSDLQADGSHWITVSNPYSDRAVKVQVRAVTQDAEARSIALELSPEDSASFDLQAGAVQLLATSESAFSLSVEDLKGGGVLNPETRVARTGRNPRTNLAGAAKSITTYCEGDWTLTCKSGGCSGLGPYTHEGRVDRFTVWINNRPRHSHRVYWNLNTPTGDYTTENHQGLTATWYPGAGICPDEVTNSLGHTYTVVTP